MYIYIIMYMIIYYIYREGLLQLFSQNYNLISHTTYVHTYDT